MKAAFVCLTGLIACAVTLSAQTPLEERLSAKILPGPKQFGEIADLDRRLVIRKVAHTLRSHVSFRTDSSAASFFDTPTGRQTIEWMDLRIKMLIPVRINEADQKAGINKRIQALLTYDACRIYDPKTREWGAWTGKGHPLFPAAITIEWKNGHPTPNAGLYVDKFKPGPSFSTGAKSTFQPGNTAPGTKPPGTKPTTGGGINRPPGNNNGLPPGMTPK